VSREKTCDTCGGTGRVTELSIVEKITFHLQVAPQAGLQLRPEEVAQLLDEIGVPAPADLPPDAWPPEGKPDEDPGS